MSRERELKLDVAKANDLSKLKSMSGWKLIESFIHLEEFNLSKKLMRVPQNEVDLVRGGLKTIEKFRKYLQVAELSATEAQEELEKYFK